jgi:hypothetical protein
MTHQKCQLFCCLFLTVLKFDESEMKEQKKKAKQKDCRLIGEEKKKHINE